MKTILYKNKFYTPVAEKKTRTGVLFLIIIDGREKWLFFKHPKNTNQWHEFLAR